MSQTAVLLYLFFFFFFNATATTEIYTLSLHDALPISPRPCRCPWPDRGPPEPAPRRDRKSTRLNSSHGSISYAVFCLKKKKTGCRTRSLILHQKVVSLRLYRVWM